jgi:hypothetical protein
MNERIRKLAGQAGFETEHHKWIFANDNVGEGECHELLEKFAELIVRECAKVSEDDITDGDACCTNTAYRIASQIKKHFGLTE